MSSRLRLWSFRIRHIIEAVEKIQRYVSGMSYQDFQSDSRTVDAVVRNLEIIGEAARLVPSEISTAYPLVPWVEMRAMRNVLAHEYYRVNLPVIWTTIHQDLPPLVPLLKALLSAEEAKGQ